MRPVPIDIEDVRAFVEIIHHSGFARAARQLGVSKSIISRRILRLEKALGTRLLNRGAADC